jgi:hypothetical protein
MQQLNRVQITLVKGMLFLLSKFPSWSDSWSSGCAREGEEWKGECNSLSDLTPTSLPHTHNCSRWLLWRRERCLAVQRPPQRLRGEFSSICHLLPPPTLLTSPHPTPRPARPSNSLLTALSPPFSQPSQFPARCCRSQLQFFEFRCPAAHVPPCASKEGACKGHEGPAGRGRRGRGRGRRHRVRIRVQRPNSQARRRASKEFVQR